MRWGSLRKCVESILRKHLVWPTSKLLVVTPGGTKKLSPPRDPRVHGAHTWTLSITWRTEPGQRRGAAPDCSQKHTLSFPGCWTGQDFDMEQTLWVVAFMLALLRTRGDLSHGEMDGDGTWGSQEGTLLSLRHR